MDLWLVGVSSDKAGLPSRLSAVLSTLDMLSWNTKKPFLLYNQLIPGENTLTPKSAAQDDEMEALYRILEYPHFN